MSRLSREEKRQQQYTGQSAAPVSLRMPVDVRVSGATEASVEGVPVVPGPGQEVQQAVLNHLHRLALSVGHPVLANIHDARVGYVVPLRVNVDGSSLTTGEPLRMTPPAQPEETAAPGTVQAPTGVFGPPPVMTEAPSLAATGSIPAATGPIPAATGPMPAAVPAPVPAPVIAPAPVVVAAPAVAPERRAPAPAPTPPAPAAVSVPASAPAPAPTQTPTPARGFDAVAEKVLGDGPVTATVEGAALLTEPMTQINEAVRAGRIETAGELAQRTVAEASAVLGTDHPEVLHLRELTAYIAYLAGDPVRAFRLSIDLARRRREARDAEAAYGNVQSAATAWRAVRDPEQGLSLGHDLIALWTDLIAEDGPAAEDIEQLDSAHARMGRLTERARALRGA